VGVIARSIYGSYPEYHTSLDDLQFVSSHAIAESVDACFSICMMLERNGTYKRTMPFCEPQLGKRGMYPNLGARRKDEYVNALMWLLNFADGEHDLLAIAERSGVDFWLLDDVAQACIRENLLVL
jgi:aminopeptidase-like protein